jgi:hypothetical protein
VVTPEAQRAWDDFRAALRDLGRLDPEFAQAYLAGAARALEGAVRDLRKGRRDGQDPEPRRRLQ